ncbi:HlyD family type I secretion periplasmic adaptor subunit [Salmonella enterica]|uniref:Membrane fusion protein (MFP) family protein n=1 Tax=Salmonella enterica TaxID=28901 RepID=A0A5U3IVL0_SALER|nr:HlyD family type I secretion periplasmic adaptor subunit [Salmonella enterica]
MLKIRKNNDVIYNFIITFVFFSLIAVICFCKVDIVIHGRGYLQIKYKNILIEHPDGGRIKSLLVREGDMVKKGQLLATIDNSYIAEESAKTMQQKKSVQIRILRLDSEIKNIPFSIPEKINDDERKYYISEADIYNSDMKSYRDEIESSESIEQKKRTELESNIIKSQGLEKELEYAEKQMKLVGNLVNMQAAAKGTLLMKQAEYQRIKNELAYNQSMKSVLQAEVDTATFETEKIKSKFKKDKNEELLKNQEMLMEINARMVGVNARKIQSEIYSPVNGRIQKLFKSNPGSVLSAGGALFEITPDNVPVIAVVKLDTKDREKVWQGMTATIDIGGTGGVKSKPVSGSVELISADSLTDDRGIRYYQADILMNIKGNRELYPGMVVDAYIRTGRRSIAEYIFAPVFNGAKVAFSEQ